MLVQDAPAFVVNRLLMRFMGEVLAAIDEGTPLEVADGALAPLGLPMSPFALLAAGRPGGRAARRRRRCTRRSRTGSRCRENLGRLVAAGKPDAAQLGRRTGRRWTRRCAALFVVGDRPSTAEQVRERALAALAEEVRLMLDEGVVAEPRTSTCA